MYSSHSMLAPFCRASRAYTNIANTIRTNVLEVCSLESTPSIHRCIQCALAKTTDDNSNNSVNYTERSHSPSTIKLIFRLPGYTNTRHDCTTLYISNCPTNEMNRIEWEWRKNARYENSEFRLSNGKIHRKLSEWNPFANAIRITSSSSYRFVFSVGFSMLFRTNRPVDVFIIHRHCLPLCPFQIVPSWSRLAFAADIAIFRFSFFFSPSHRPLRRDAIIICAHRMVRTSFISFLAPQKYVHTHTL